MSEQQRLVHRLRQAFEPDDRFRALFLTGSMGRGDDDAFSDVDTVLVVQAGMVGQIVDWWNDVAAPLGPFVLVKPIPGAPVFNHVLPGWLRWDVTVTSSDAIPALVEGQVKVVFDKDLHPLAAARLDGIDLDAAHGVAVEFFRCLALLPVVLGRDDTVTAVSGTQLLRQLTIQLIRLVDEPGATSGALHLRRCLTPEHYAALAALPALRADIGSIIEGHRALRDLFVPIAESTLADRYPDQLAQAALARLAPLLDLGPAERSRE